MGGFKNGVSIGPKGYPRIKCGPLRDQLVHRIVAAALIGRDLKPDEEVDHKDRDKKNPHWSNLVIRGSSDHGWVSAKQAYFMRHKDAEEKKVWDEFMVEQNGKQAAEIQAAKADGVPWEYEDGALQEAWRQRV